MSMRFEDLSFNELMAVSAALPTMPGWKERQAQSRKEEQELFGKGRRSWSDDEIDIIFSNRLTRAEKIEKLTAPRQAKAAKRAARRATQRPKAVVIPFRFQDRVTQADAIRAKALGVSL